MKKLAALATPVQAKAKPRKRVVIFETDEALIAGLDACARAARVSRSWLIRAVLQGWISDKKGELGQ